MVHAADLHIDSPMRGISRYEGLPIDLLRTATRKAFINLIDLCLERKIEVLLLAGDLFDGDWKDFATGLFFAAQLRRLGDVGTRVFMVRGNHDAASRLSRSLPWPGAAHVFDHQRPETVRDEALGIAVHGQSFATASVDTDLAARYPEPDPALFNIGLLHTSLDGRPGHAPYAPTTRQRLEERGYAYWALGHVHQREVISSSPHIVYPGNLQGRHANETGDKGATFVETTGTRVATIEHVSLDVLRWVRIDITVPDAGSAVDSARDALLAVRREHASMPLIARVTLRTPDLSLARPAVVETLRAELCAIAMDDDVWIEKVEVHPHTPATRADETGFLHRILQANADDVRPEAEALLEEIRKRLPPEVRRRAEWSTDTDALLTRAIADAQGIAASIVASRA